MRPWQVRPLHFAFPDREIQRHTGARSAPEESRLRWAANIPIQRLAMVPAPNTFPKPSHRRPCNVNTFPPEAVQSDSFFFRKLVQRRSPLIGLGCMLQSLHSCSSQHCPPDSTAFGHMLTHRGIRSCADVRSAPEKLPLRRLGTYPCSTLPRCPAQILTPSRPIKALPSQNAFRREPIGVTTRNPFPGVGARSL